MKEEDSKSPDEKSSQSSHHNSHRHNQRKSSRYILPDKKFNVEFPVPADYDYSKSSEQNYHRPHSSFVGKYKAERSQLDYSFHLTYSEERQLFHDQLIDKFHKTVVHDTKHDWYCESPLENWIVFTAGVMGAGKGHTMEWLDHQGLFPKEAFVNVDPDAIRYLLPEFDAYNQIDNTKTGYLTQKEVGYISEVLTYHALQQGKNVLIDGSLRDAHWYLEYFKNLRDTFPKVKLAIIHIDAPLDAIISRCNSRARVTGRHVPPQLIRETAAALPQSLAILSPQVEFFTRIMNGHHREKYLDYAEMKQRVNNERGRAQSFLPQWRLVHSPHPSHSSHSSRKDNSHKEAEGKTESPMTYTFIDDERQEERVLSDWRSTFTDVWTMTCEIPIPWMPPEAEMKKPIDVASL